MIGNPKYKYGDIVQFNINGVKKVGKIEIIDKYGIFFDNTDVFYDVLVEPELCLYKHIREDHIAPYY